METKSRLVSKALLVSTIVAFGLSAGALPPTTAIWSHNDGSGFGKAVTTAGDFNCDGVADLLVGFPNASALPNGASFFSQAGWVGVWFGGSTLPPQPTGQPDWFALAFTGLPAINQTNAHMGTAVAAGDVNGDGCDDVIASAPGPGNAGEVVNVYFGDPEGPSTSFNWRRFGGASSGRFGASVATGDVNGDGIADILIGAPDAASGQQNEGEVLVWLGKQNLASTPSGQDDSDWMAQSNQLDAHLGESVAGAGDVDGDGDDEILAGAPNFDGTIPGSTDEGIVWMWNGTPVLATAPDGTPANASFHLEIGGNGSHLGASVAAAGDLDGDGFADILVGAPDFDSPFVSGAANGTVLAIRGQASGPPSDVFSWSHIGLFANGRLGASLSTAGDVNGDGRADYVMGEPGSQHMYLLLGRATFGANPPPDVTYTQASTSQYGAAVGTAGDWNGDGFSDVVAGAPGSGQVFVYPGAADTLAASPSSALRMGQANAGLGLGMGFAGDINHDGCTDFVAGAPNYDDGQTDEGRIFVQYGTSAKAGTCPQFFEIIAPGQRESNQAGAQLGFSATGAGDVNGDGYADVVAGAPLYDQTVICGIHPLVICPVADVGRVYVYFGGSGGLAFDANQVLDAVEAGGQFGYSVASAGDVNGDGYGDVIVGAPYGSPGGLSQSGRAFLYLGGPTGLTPSFTWTAVGTTANAHFGISVASAGDVNGDGYGDVIIGADGHAGTGAAFLYLGQPTNAANPQGLGKLPVRTYLGSGGSEFGRTVATAGDINRDGFSDFAVGAPGAYAGNDFTEGLVMVYHGAPTLALPLSPTTTLQGDAPIFDTQRFGSGVAAAGDVNGDGFGDLIVGDQWFFGPAGFAQGKAYLFHGSASGLSTTPARTFQDCTTSFCDFGRDVSGGGDIDGDGFPDVLIGAFKDSTSASFEGAVFVHKGNGGGGMPVTPLQAVGFGGAPLALLGATSGGSVDGSLKLHSPAGRTNVQLELEVKPLGTSFDGLGSLLGVHEDNVLFDRSTLTFGVPVGGKEHWRARLHSVSPLFGYSRWISLPGNAARELDVRKVPEPELVAGLLASVGMLAALAHRRARTARD